LRVDVCVSHASTSVCNVICGQRFLHCSSIAATAITCGFPMAFIQPCSLMFAFDVVMFEWFELLNSFECVESCGPAACIHVHLCLSVSVRRLSACLCLPSVSVSSVCLHACMYLVSTSAVFQSCICMLVSACPCLPSVYVSSVCPHACMYLVYASAVFQCLHARMSVSYVFACHVSLRVLSLRVMCLCVSTCHYPYHCARTHVCVSLLAACWMISASMSNR
jgi:hypothetical protein